MPKPFTTGGAGLLREKAIVEVMLPLKDQRAGPAASVRDGEDIVRRRKQASAGFASS
jgi:hypothetical protein